MKSSYKQRHQLWQKVTISSFLLLFLILGFRGSVSVASTLGEEFLTSGSFDKGSIVSLKKDNPKDIELTTVSNGEYILGVVNDSGDNLVTYAKDGSDISVSLFGEVQVFVTDVQGDVSKGDFVGASWLEGVGMKADVNDRQRLLGVALEDFDSSAAEYYGEIETPDGNKQVKIDTVLVRLFDKETFGESSSAKDGFEGFVRKLAGREVSFAKIVSVSLIFLTSTAIAGFFVTSSIRGSFVSLGRNPRASAAIYRSLLHVTMVALIVILMGTALSYVVLVL